MQRLGESYLKIYIHKLRAIITPGILARRSWIFTVELNTQNPKDVLPLGGAYFTGQGGCT
jgi:hypothetical protein